MIVLCIKKKKQQEGKEVKPLENALTLFRSFSFILMAFSTTQVRMLKHNKLLILANAG